MCFMLLVSSKALQKLNEWEIIVLRVSKTATEDEFKNAFHFLLSVGVSSDKQTLWKPHQREYYKLKRIIKKKKIPSAIFKK